MPHHPRPPSTNRACEACKKKKAKCDGRRPKCSLCVRTDGPCVYPPRKLREPARHLSVVNANNGSATHPSPNSHAFAPPGSLVDDFSVGGGASGQSIQQQQMQDAYVSDLAGHDLQSNALTMQDSPSGPNSDNESLAIGPFADPNPESLDIFTYLASDFPDFMTQQEQDISLLGFLPHSLDELTVAVPPADITPPAPVRPFSSELGGMSSTGRLSSNTTGSSDNVLPPPQRSDSSSRRRYSMEVTPDIVGDIVEIYFRRVQAFLPLFNGPQFLQIYIGKLGDDLYRNITGETYFILNAICALACRYSTGLLSGDYPAEDRGKAFASRARQCFRDISSCADFELSLRWLQGSILLAYYNQNCHPEWGLDGMVETCVRYAHSLRLHEVDKERLNLDYQEIDHAGDSWIVQEERRRAWWSVWELGAFTSVSFRSPFLIDLGQSWVRLPVSDEAWFSGKQVDSPVFTADSVLCWKCLRHSPNQDTRAWFLISNFIMVQIHELAQKAMVTKRQVDHWGNILACFSVLFYEIFDPELQSLPLDEEMYSRSNWLVLSQLMVHVARIILKMLQDRVVSEPILSQANQFFDRAGKPLWSKDGVRTHQLPSFWGIATDIFRVFRAWSWAPRAISYAPPTMIGVVIGPGWIVLRLASVLGRRPETSDDRFQASVEEDIVFAIVGQLARYWKTNSLLLNFARESRQALVERRKRLEGVRPP